MAKARNIVVAGDYTMKTVQIADKVEGKEHHIYPAIIIKPKLLKPIAQWDHVKISNETVSGYSMDEVDAMSAQKTGVYKVIINFVDGKRSMLEVDKKMYEMIVRACF